MAEDGSYDVVIVGSGTGGYSCALRAAQLGMSVAMVEKESRPGGTCLHWGCIPTKAMLQAAEVAEFAQASSDYGVKAQYEGIDLETLHEYKNKIVDTMTKGLEATIKGRGVESIQGRGRFVDANTVEVEGPDGDTRSLQGDALVIATGSVPREIPPAPFDQERIINSDDVLHLSYIPERAIVLGAGAVGMEFASIWHAYGAEVTVIEMMDRLLPLEDEEISKEIQKHFKQNGIQSMTGTTLSSAEVTNGQVACTVESNGDEDKLEADVLLVAVGRRPRTQNIGLEDIGVEVEDGFVQVDEYCQTSVEGVYAVGDIIPTLGLAHASFMEGVLVADLLYGNDVTPIDYAGVPRVTFCHPEVASVGLSEKDAKDRGYEVKVEKFPFQHVGRAQMMRKKGRGLVKLVAQKDGKMLGIHIVGPHATDLIAEAELIYNWEALPIDVARFIHPHPTLSEAIGEAHMALAGRALHGG